VALILPDVFFDYSLSPKSHESNHAHPEIERPEVFEKGRQSG
jgi:hypothetical protein